MGLASNSVKIATEILTEIVHMQVNNKRYETTDEYEEYEESEGSLPIIEYEKDDERTHSRTMVIMVAGRKSTPGAWENVWVHLEGIDSTLLNYFYDRKKEVPNTHFINFKRYQSEGIVEIGWF